MNQDLSFNLNLLLFMRENNEKIGSRTLINIDVVKVMAMDYSLPSFLLDHIGDNELLALSVGSKASPSFQAIIKEGNEFLAFATSFNAKHYELLVPVLSIVNVVGDHSTAAILFNVNQSREDITTQFQANKDKAQAAQERVPHLQIVKKP